MSGMCELVPLLVAQNKELNRENERLRTTLAAALIRLSAANDAAGGGYIGARFADELRELGIEVSA